MHFDTNSASLRCRAFVQACVIAHLRAQSQLDTRSPPDAPCAREKRRFRLPTLMHTSQHSTHAAGALLLGLFRPLPQHLPRSARRTLLLRSPLTRSESVFSNIIHRPFRRSPLVASVHEPQHHMILTSGDSMSSHMQQALKYVDAPRKSHGSR